MTGRMPWSPQDWAQGREQEWEQDSPHNSAELRRSGPAARTGAHRGARGAIRPTPRSQRLDRGVGLLSPELELQGRAAGPELRERMERNETG